MVRRDQLARRERGHRLMALLCYNLTASPVTLAATGAGQPTPPVIPAQAAPPVLGPPVNVTSYLRTCTSGNFASIQAQVAAGSIYFEWTQDPEFATVSLAVASHTTLQAGAKI